MKKLVLTYGLMLTVVLSMGAINSSSADSHQHDGQEMVCCTSAIFVAADDDFSFDVMPVQKAITLFGSDFPNFNLYINTSPTFHLSPELLASREKSNQAFSRYSSALKI